MHDLELTHSLAQLSLQLGIILVAARIGGIVAARLRLPSLVGEIAAGVIIGPYALGQLELFGFGGGIIPLVPGPLPISMELYAFAVVGAVVHIFLVGLESDARQIARMRYGGLAVAVSGAIVAFIVGAAVPVVFFDAPLSDPRVLFFAGISVSTSVGVQARILSQYRKMDAPDGALVIEASILQDGLAIMILAAAVALAAAAVPETVERAGTLFSSAAPVLVRAIVVWAVGFFLLFVFAPQISKALKYIGAPAVAATPALALALLVSGLFELAGIASIIGAYGVGIALSRTDVADIVEERMKPVAGFFVPVLYAILGMFIDFRVLITPGVLFPGVGFAVFSAVAKVVGSGVPAVRHGFTPFGALRIGVGTLPRGEVALIMGIVGVAAGLISAEAFKIITVMVIVSVVGGSQLFSRLLRSGRPVRTDTDEDTEPAITALDLPNEEIAELVTAAMLRSFDEDGFIVHRLELSGTVYRMRKERLSFTMTRYPLRVELSGDPRDDGFMKTALYEVLVHVTNRVNRLTTMTVPEKMRRDAAEATGRETVSLSRYFSADRAIVPLVSSDHEGAIAELVSAIADDDAVTDSERVLDDVLERERSVSTGMEHGLAIPHAKTDGVTRIVCSVGLSQNGVEFGAVDRELSRLIILIASPKDSKGPHLQLLAALVQHIRNESVRTAAFAASDADELVTVLTTAPKPTE